MNGALWAAILVVILASQCQPIQCQCQCRTSLDDVMAKLDEIQATVNDTQTTIGAMQAKQNEQQTKIDNLLDMQTEQNDKIDMIDPMKSVLDFMAKDYFERDADDKKFVASSTCALGEYQSFLIVDPRLPAGVSDRAVCSLNCRYDDECKGYNIITQGDEQCQLFTSNQPSSFAETAGCQYYKKIPALQDDPCLPNPCQNGGKCCATCPDYTCTCTPGWTGKDCTDRENNTLVQQNIDGSDFFVKNWTEYKAGFVNESGNYWIGNDRLHALTKTGQYKLRVELLYRVDNSTWYYAEYSQFIVDNETSNYTMSYSGFNGTTDNWLRNDTQFSTRDVDNDGSHYDCGADGGFWYPSGCGNVFINSLGSSTSGFTWRNDALGDKWSNWKLQTSRMTLIY